MAFMHQEQCHRGIRFFRMETAAQYRLFAEECERLAKQPGNESYRQVLIEMAAEWRTLAQAEENST
jgi:hypothetical protein